MVVADGMGGQNAGEVASAIAIDSVQEMFSPDELPANVIEKPDTIKQFLKKVVSECDIRIKQKAKEDSSTAGMGSTIVLSWLVNDKLYIAWLGDSRAYSFVPKKGIARLSKDHSYVQQLVDAGAITEDEAMDHPNSNVITRSLGDTSQKAKADVEEYSLQDGEIILLCSDGLCGVCTDDEIAGVLTEEANDLQVCKEQLTNIALDNGGSDNITIALMQISCNEEEKGEKEKKSRKHFCKKILFGIFALLVVVLIGLFSMNRLFQKVSTPSKVQTTDSVRSLGKSDTSEVTKSRYEQQTKVKKKVQNLQLQKIKNEVQQNLGAGSFGTTPKEHPEEEITESKGKNNGGSPTQTD